jgi:hypothetical protein
MANWIPCLNTLHSLVWCEGVLCHLHHFLFLSSSGGGSTWLGGIQICFSYSNKSNIMSHLLTSKSYLSPAISSLTHMHPKAWDSGSTLQGQLLARQNQILISILPSALAATCLLFSGIGSQKMKSFVWAEPDSQSLEMWTYLWWQQSASGTTALWVGYQTGSSWNIGWMCLWTFGFS